VKQYWLNTRVPYKFGDVGINQLCKVIRDITYPKLPNGDELPIERMFTLKLSKAVKEIEASDLYTLLMTCGKKTILEL
jgi:hypothetical protein